MHGRCLLTLEKLKKWIELTNKLNKNNKRLEIEHKWQSFGHMVVPNEYARLSFDRYRVTKEVFS